MVNKYLCTEIPLYASDARVKTKWLELAAAKGSLLSSSLPSSLTSEAHVIDWEAVPDDLQQAETYTKRRVDMVHEQLGQQSDVVRQVRGEHSPAPLASGFGSFPPSTPPDEIIGCSSSPEILVYSIWWGKKSFTNELPTRVVS